MKIHILNWLSFAKDPEPPPPDSPERDPEWCHSHGQTGPCPGEKR